MDRRSFVGLLGGMGAGLAAAAETEKRTRFFVVQSYKLKAGTQLPRMHEFFKTKLVPQAATVWNGPKLFLEAIVAPHMPQILALYGFTSLEEFLSAHGKTFSNPDVAKGFAELESGPEPPAETSDSMLLETAPYSPEMLAGAREKPRIFEMRVYHSPTYRQLAALHERFAGPEIKIFHRSGIH